MASQNLELTQKIGIRMSQQQLRFVRMLEMNAPELDETVERELEDNPALGVEEETTEEDRQRYPLYQLGRSHTGEERVFAPADESDTLYDNLLAQLSEQKLTAAVETAAHYIIGSLDSNGYLSRSTQEIANDMAFSQGIDLPIADIEAGLEAVRRLDPPGIGARNLQDCLRMQLEKMPRSERVENALRIVNDAYDAFTMKHKHRIMSLLHLSAADADSAVSLILSLNPKPGAALGNDADTRTNVIIPDFVVNIEDGEISIALNNNIPELRIEQSFEQAMATLERTPKGRPKKGSEFIVSRYNDARDFIRILSQRQQTMMKVMTSIVSIQKEYFLTEDIYKLKPMMIKNIAEITGLDISTISRVTSNKHVALPWGIFPLRFFFSDSIGDDKEGTDAATNRKIEASISELIAKEDKRHPLSDRVIMEKLAEQGYELSRRTVAKYRDRQGIPVARLRKEL